MEIICKPILLSVISRAGLEGGVYRDPAQAGIRRPRLDAMLAALPVLAFDDTAPMCIGRLSRRSGIRAENCWTG
jgi:hypothetical protein